MYKDEERILGVEDNFHYQDMDMGIQRGQQYRIQPQGSLARQQLTGFMTADANYSMVGPQGQLAEPPELAMIKTPRKVVYYAPSADIHPKQESNMEERVPQAQKGSC